MPMSPSHVTPFTPAAGRLGEEMEPVYHLDKADVVVALDADFLAWGPGRLKERGPSPHVASRSSRRARYPRSPVG